MLIAMDVAMMVRQCGCTVVGPVGELEKALGTAQQNTLDGGVLDIQLDRERVWPLAEHLQDRGVPMILLSGYSKAEVPQRFADLPLLSKPVNPRTLQSALESLGLIRG